MHEQPRMRPVAIDCDGTRLRGDLAVPAKVRGLVVFAHGSGSSRHSPRNRRVAQVLQDDGLATLLFDLLTDDEDLHEQLGASRRFDIDLLTERLLCALDWCAGKQELSALPVALFGASTGAAAALAAARWRPRQVAAVVSRGGRPDLAHDILEEVQTPVLLIVGGEDHAVLGANQQAAALLRDAKVHVVPGAGHLFSESGALETVARVAADWLATVLPAPRRPPSPTAMHNDRTEPFEDRHEAARILGSAVEQRIPAQRRDRLVVLGMPRGGVPIAAHLAARLDAPMSVVLVRKVGAAGQPEFGIGAVAEGGVAYIEERSAQLTGTTGPVLRRIIDEELRTIDRRSAEYFRDHARPSLEGRDVIVVDDGLATGVTAVAAGKAVRQQGARTCVLAVPVCAEQSIARMRDVYDDVICPVCTPDLRAIGFWYRDFRPVTDAEVVRLLSERSVGSYPASSTRTSPSTSASTPSTPGDGA